MSDSVEYMLTKVRYNWLHRYQRHTVTPSNTQSNSKQTGNDSHDLHNVPDHAICGRNEYQFSFSLLISELLSILLLCLMGVSKHCSIHYYHN